MSLKYLVLSDGWITVRVEEGGERLPLIPGDMVQDILDGIDSELQVIGDTDKPAADALMEKRKMILGALSDQNAAD